jgi:hypothetical protein
MTGVRAQSRGFPRRCLLGSPWSLASPAAPCQTVRAVLPHTAFRHRSPSGMRSPVAHLPGQPEHSQALVPLGLTCPACGLTFETHATTNTRCRRCRKVVNVRRSAASPGGSSYRPPATEPIDDVPSGASPALIGIGLVGGGAWALWHGWKAKPSSEDESAGAGRWLWCLVGASLVVLGVWVLTRS